MAVTHAQIGLWTDEYATLQIQIEALETVKEELKKKLKDVVPAGETIIVGSHKVIHQIALRTSLNTSLLKKDAPGLYEKYSESKEVASLIVR